MVETLQSAIDKKLNTPRFRRGGPIDFQPPITPQVRAETLGEPSRLFTHGQDLPMAVVSRLAQWQADPVSALQQIPEDFSAAGRNIAAYTAGLAGDVQPIAEAFSPALKGRERLPTSDELMDSFGDREHFSNVPAMFVAPGPGEVKAGAVAAKTALKALVASAKPGTLGYAVAQSLFHGTPFGRFDKVAKGGRTDNILDIFHPDNAFSGEGKQAFGYTPVGYFAEDAGVAGSYRDKLSDIRSDPTAEEWIKTYGSKEKAIEEAKRNRETVVGQFFNEPVPPGSDRFSEIQEIRQKFGDDALNGMVKDSQRLIEEQEVWDTTIKAIEDYNPGHLLEVEFDDKAIARMLDWDAPLSEQPELQRILSAAGGDIKPTTLLSGKKGLTRVGADGSGTNIFGIEANTDAEAFAQLTGERAYRILAKDLGGEQAASKALNEAGIPGIRFYDGNSRFKAGGTFKVSETQDGWQTIVNPPASSSHGGVSAVKTFDTKDAAEAFGKSQTEQGTRNIVPFNPDDITQVKRDGEIIFGGNNALNKGLPETKTDVADNALLDSEFAVKALEPDVRAQGAAAVGAGRGDKQRGSIKVTDDDTRGVNALKNAGGRGAVSDVEFAKQQLKEAIESGKEAKAKYVDSAEGTQENRDALHRLWKAQADEQKWQNEAYPTPKVTEAVDDGYKMQHEAPMRDSGAPGHDLTGGGDIYPDDVYTMGQQYYGTGDDALDAQSFAIARGMKNHPNKRVTVYRAVPADVKKINTGDWITINRKYAKDHMEGEEGWKIIQKTVSARDIYTNGDSIHEWGYDPQPWVSPNSLKRDKP